MSEKYYQLGTHTAEQWCEIHRELMSEQGTDTIPNRCVTCVDDKPHSPTRGTFLLTDEEAEILKLDSRIKFINIDYTSYPEIYKPDPEELQATSPSLLNRWRGSNVKVYREFEISNTLPISPNAADTNRTGFQLLRPMQKLDPWVATTPTGVVGSFVSVPNGWITENDIAAYTFLGTNPGNLSFTVTIQGPSNLEVLLDAAVDGVAGSINLECEIEILDSQNAQVAVYNDSFIAQTNGNIILNQIIPGGLAGNEIYTINYTMTYSINNATENDFTWAIGINANLGLISTPISDNAVLERNIEQFGDGKDVDVIVADDGAGWIGHPEFQNNTLGARPWGYVGGNVLPGNGTCDILDLVLDAPYYLDPDYFDADPANRLITRWDGTRVPVETVARAWWANTSNRSSTFNTAYPTAGTVSVTSLYTRAYNNGTNTTPSTSGQHATPCLALTYGRTQGWAYNANKWALNLYGTNGSDIEPGFDLQKIFHQTKPVNPKYDTKDPTVSSNSWGYRSSTKGGSFYHFRENAPVAYGGTSDEPAFISHMGATGDTGRWKSEFQPNSILQAADELCDAGVIFVVAAGNSNQKQVKWNHPDYNNYISATSDQSLEDTTYFDIGIAVYGTTNRRGFPQMAGKVVLDEVTGEIEHKAINIGALDDDFAAGNRERKVNYSDRGNDIDFYMPADGTLSANLSYGPEGRYPDTYPGFTANTGSGAGVPEDTAFGGTSAACPVAAGFIACLMGLNRNWTYQEVRNYIQSLDVQDSNRFYYGTESTSATSSNWLDYNSLEGGDARVGYQDITKIQQTTFPIRSSSISNGLTMNGVSINYVQRLDRG